MGTAGVDAAAGEPGRQEKSDRQRFRFFRALVRKRSGQVAVAFVGLILAIAIFGPLVIGGNPTETNLIAANKPPVGFGGTWAYPLGTDMFGRDLLTRLVYGSRTSLFIGIVAATISAALGTALGLLAGYYDRTVGPVVLRLAEVQFSLPFTVIALAVIAVFGGGLRNLVILLAFIGWAGYARTIAVSVAQVNRSDFIRASSLQGAGPVRIMVRHILPNVWGPIIVLWSTSAGVLILVESALSFIGLGVQSPQFSWGSMLAEAENQLQTAWWEAVFPGVALTLTVVAFNLLGDAIRDALNVRLPRS